MEHLKLKCSTSHSKEVFAPGWVCISRRFLHRRGFVFQGGICTGVGFISRKFLHRWWFVFQGGFLQAGFVFQGGFSTGSGFCLKRVFCTGMSFPGHLREGEKGF